MLRSVFESLFSISRLGCYSRHAIGYKMTPAHTEVNPNVARRVMLTLFSSRCESLNRGG